MLLKRQGDKDGSKAFPMPESFNECIDESGDRESIFQGHLNEYKFRPIEDPPQLAYSILTAIVRGEERKAILVSVLIPLTLLLVFRNTNDCDWFASKSNGYL